MFSCFPCLRATLYRLTTLALSCLALELVGYARRERLVVSLIGLVDFQPRCRVHDGCIVNVNVLLGAVQAVCLIAGVQAQPPSRAPIARVQADDGGTSSTVLLLDCITAADLQQSISRIAFDQHAHSRTQRAGSAGPGWQAQLERRGLVILRPRCEYIRSVMMRVNPGKLRPVLSYVLRASSSPKSKLQNIQSTARLRTYDVSKHSETISMLEYGCYVKSFSSFKNLEVMLVKLSRSWERIKYWLRPSQRESTLST